MPMPMPMPTRKRASTMTTIRLLGGFHKVHTIWRSPSFTRSIGGRAAADDAAVAVSFASGSEAKFPTPPARSLRQRTAAAAAVPIPMAASSAWAAPSEEKGLTSPAQGLRQEDKTAAADVSSTTAACAAAVPTPMAASSAGAAPSEEKGPTSPAQSLRQEEIGDKTAAAADVSSTTDVVPTPMAASSPSLGGAAGSQEKGPTSPAGGGSLRAIVLVLTVVAIAVTTLLMAHFDGHPMSQVWILLLSICSYVFFFLLSISWSRRSFYTNFCRLSYGPMLAFCSAHGIGSATATFVLFFSMAWASGNFGYYLALHRLHKGTETAIRALPSPSYPTKATVRNFNATLYNFAPFMVLLWTLVMAFFVYVTAGLNEEMYILMTLSYFGWIHVAFWLVIVNLAYMPEFPLKESMGWLLPALIIWFLLSHAICFLSEMFATLCNLLLMMALVAFLWYNLAIYMHFLATGAPSKILEDKIGLMKPDPRLGTTSGEAAATLGNEDILHSEILEGKFGPVKSDPRLEEHQV